MKKILMASIVVAGVCAAARAGDLEHPAARSAEFQRAARLAGTWKGTAQHSDGKSEPVTVTYRLTSGGSTIEETLMPGTPHEMVSMYHDENGKLAMTHYCMMGNTPRLGLKEASSKRIALELIPGSGVDPQESHMHALVLETPDPDHLTQTWTSYSQGKPQGTTVFMLARASKS